MVLHCYDLIKSIVMLCYPQVLNTKSDEDEKTKALKEKVKLFHEVIHAVCPRKSLPSIESLCKPPTAVNHLHYSEFFLFVVTLFLSFIFRMACDIFVFPV